MTRAKLGGGPGLVWVLAAVLGIWLWVSLPLALGQRTVYFRDVGSLHFPMKAFGAGELRQGRIPAFNPTWGMGHPFRGNPQALAFYPDNVLYLILPFWSAFNLHFALHWLLAALGMGLLARKLEISPAGAVAAAVTYAGSGFFLTAFSSFYHIVAVAAWWPFVLWGAAAGGRRGIALGGVACGLALLGGEPLLAALGVVPLWLLASERWGWRRGLLTAAGIGGVGLLLALPQLVATWRILPFTFRGAHGVPAGQVSVYSLQAVRLFELALPLPFGAPASLGAGRFWGGTAVPGVPLFLSIHFGIVGLALAVAAARSRHRWAALAAAGLGLAWAGGVWGRPLAVLSAGLFRFPEKFLFWTALAAPLLVGWGVARVVESQESRERFVRGVAVAAVLALTFAAGTFGSLATVARILERAGAPAELARAHAGMWVEQLAAAGVLLALAAWAAHRGSATALAAAQLAALLPLAPLVMTTATAPLAAPSPWLRALQAPRALPAGAGVVSNTQASPFLDPPPPYRTAAGATFASRVALSAAELDPFPGVLAGLTYPLAPDVDGFAPPLSTFVAYNLPLLPSWRERASWLRATGVTAVAGSDVPPIPGLAAAGALEHAGVRVELLRVAAPAPEAWWPARLVTASGPVEAFRAVSLAADPVGEVTVTSPVPAHDPAGRVRVLESSPDRVVLESEGKGGVAVLRRAFQPLLVARGEGGRLPTFPVDVLLTGIAVPPGRQRIVLATSAAPELTAAAISLLTLIGALGIARAGSGQAPAGGAKWK